MREQAEQALKERCKSVQPTVVYCYVAPVALAGLLCLLDVPS